ncbi:MAG: hypothetical protein PHP04_06790 [Bacteroidales bacterium]|nr:hypothetical protein [Bacteroidales bacterium]
MKKIMIFIFSLLLTSTIVQSQTAEDVLRFSRINYSGTARFNALSGAFGAVGADFSTLATNPAGLGLYSVSEMTLTIAPTIGSTHTNYNGSEASENRVNFGLGNFGFVFSIKPSKNSSILKSINIGFGFNRQNDFNNQMLISGVNKENSLMQNYTNILNEGKIPPSTVTDTYPFDIGLAYGTNLVFYNTNNEYECDAKYGGVLQTKQVNSYGSVNELDFSVGTNLNNTLFLGLTLGIPMVSYYENSIYQESRTNDTLKNFISLKYRYNLQTRGTGFNVKFGMIYKPVQWFRVGAAIHSPTWYPGMQDEWFSSMQSSFDTLAWNASMDSPIGYYDYQMRTPFRAIGSLAFIIGKYGLLSADYEYVNYSQGRLTSSDDSFSEVNSEIENNFQSFGNIRIGTEWGISSFRIRGGFAYFSNPFNEGINNGEKFQVSGGLGYRSKSFFADVTYVWSRMNQDYYLYDATMVNPSHNTYYSNTVLTTIGFRF